MNDSITNCEVSKNLSGAVQGYNITFVFDDSNLPYFVYVGSSMLSDLNDLVEVKKVACQKAKVIKDSYLAAISTSTSIITDLNGPVVL